jgi:CheY-like chemotaxis protein
MKKQPAPVKSVVFVIDDDASIRDSLRSLLRSVDLNVELFGSTEDFLQAERPDVPCCLVLDVRLPGQSGLEFQNELARAGADMPIIFLTGHGDIPMTVQAMKAGAVEFLTKPCRLCYSDSAGKGGYEFRCCGIGEQANCWRDEYKRGHGQNASRQRNAKNEGALIGRVRPNGRSVGHWPCQNATLDLSTVSLAPRNIHSVVSKIGESTRGSGLS